MGGAQRAGRAQGGRRNIRMRQAALLRARGQLYRVEEDEEVSSSGDDDEPDIGIEEDIERTALKKIGTKKLKRIQEKAERKERREVGVVSCACRDIRNGHLLPVCSKSWLTERNRSAGKLSKRKRERKSWKQKKNRRSWR